MKTLILMRHAKAEPQRGKDDFLRALAERGRTAAPLVGGFLKTNRLVAERVLVSGAVRTRETYALAAAIAGLPPAEFQNDLYLAPANALLAFIRKTPARSKSLMIIGHNPGLAELTQWLAAPEESDGAALFKAARKFPTASVAVFDVLTPWSEVGEGDCALKRFVTPSDLGGHDED
ncbi:MAG TPA: histidine phosphatase family protein [Beijerinckiaceae bacterium]|nr:histidine phosphatase family protein [Beijerinckiaceae bacterium]